ncbi:MAG: restriction endonuclease subunit S [Prevotella sp.]|nr:restriction endonuclease subunit S [Prevotella sp.]
MTGQQLKNSILQEAIEGCLVPQDPNDEPASVLLDKIRREKARLVKEGKLKKKDLEETPISEDEKPFEIPESWEWVNLKFLFHFLQGIQIDKELQSETRKEGQVRFLRIIDYTQGTEPPRFIDDPGERYHVKSTDIVMLRYGTPGLPCRGLDGILANNLFRIIPYDEGRINSDFIFLFFKTLYFQSFCKSYGVALNAIKFSTIDNVLFPLPPLAEQKRIVAKIEELLPKVEAYGKAQESLDKLNEELPERLKKSILQEAIEGRLVPQDPNDEPASVLLDKIRKEKARLVKEGKLKKKDLKETPISEDEIPYKIPESWEWTRLGNHISAISGLAYKKDDLAIHSNEYVRVLRGGNIFFGSWCLKDDDVMIGKQFVNDELILKRGMFISPAVTSLEHMGKTALIREDQNNIVAGGFVLMLIPHFNNETYWEYLNVLFQSGYYREKCKSITNKSGQAFFNLSRAKLLDLLIPLPPLSEQHRIVAKIEELFKEIDKLKV